MTENPTTALSALAAEAAREGYRSRAQERIFYGRLILACWVATGICGVIGATLGQKLGAGFGVAAIWFFVTGAALVMKQQAHG